jgi:energy-coupling factor transporter ATP-binding protein EcfA2
MQRITRRRVYYPFIGDKTRKQVTVTHHDVNIVRETERFYVLDNGKRLRKDTILKLEEV